MPRVLTRSLSSKLLNTDCPYTRKYRIQSAHKAAGLLSARTAHVVEGEQGVGHILHDAPRLERLGEPHLRRPSIVCGCQSHPRLCGCSAVADACRSLQSMEVDPTLAA